MASIEHQTDDMQRSRRKSNVKLIAVLLTMLAFMCLPALFAFAHAEVASSSRSNAAIDRTEGAVAAELSEQGLHYGAPLYLQITKQPQQLSAFVQSSNGSYQHFKSWPICSYSGGLGPKQKEGDGKSPEGFYTVTPASMNPNSSYHLSFNLGYPNAYDRAQGYTGSFLMVHGKCASIGCYAMGDDAIEEIWTLMTRAFEGGQSVIPVHIFPFEMTARNLQAYAGHAAEPFWRELAPAWIEFEDTAQPPMITVANGHYVLAGVQ